MKTPIYDFVSRYISSNPSRLHMPGHKGNGPLGIEKYDITEIKGADALYEADGIIAESEANATALFGTGRTLYSTEGSSHAIRAMIYLAYLSSGGKSTSPYILAARNVHKSFLYACALVGCEAEFIYPDSESSICQCTVSKERIKKALGEADELPIAVYITSPDYLGNTADIKGIAEACNEYGVPLLVDNAHGAYLSFLEKSAHPIALGAYMCSDSAHKTLPVLTGGAYLHLSERANSQIGAQAKSALALFGSTSPSYLILQSLDLCNRYIDDGYTKKLAETVSKIDNLKKTIAGHGISVLNSEPLKITLDAAQSGYTGREIAEHMRKSNIEPEFCDRDYIVFMLSPENRKSDLEALKNALTSLDILEPLNKTGLFLKKQKKVMSIRSSFLAPHETVSVSKAVGRICAEPTVSCPPAIPIVLSGEIITEDAVKIFKDYGIDEISVVK